MTAFINLSGNGKQPAVFSWQCAVSGLKRHAVFWVLGLMLVWSAPQAAAASYGYILQESSYAYLDMEQILDMPVQVVYYARCEIYARNGCRFESDEVQHYFDQQYWYSPVYNPGDFSDSMLNVYEQENVRLLEVREAALGGYTPGSGDYTEIYNYIQGYQQEYYSVYDVDPDCYIFHDSDSRYLSEDELTALSPKELCYARNEIYARHGRLFQSQELQEYFDQKNWYLGFVLPESFSESVLNSFELSNIQLLAQEEYNRSPSGYVLDQPGYSYEDLGSYYNIAVSMDSSDISEEYIFPDSNARYLTEEELSGLSLQTLCYARNEIYARRGYIFQSQELRDYFGRRSWYYATVPAASFSSSVFNEWEAANIELLQRCEYSLNPNGYQLY